MLLLIFIVAIAFKVKDIKVVRIFGFELISLLFCLLAALFIIGEVLLPAPQYYIKHGISNELTLNKILEQETIKSGIKFDGGSFRILDSHGMHFNHLFLCSYEIDGIEEVRIFHFEKNIFGNMKPKYPLNGNNVIMKSNNWDDFYCSNVKDGIFADYALTAGFGTPKSESIYRINKYTMDGIQPSGYFMWIEMTRETWKFELMKIGLYAGVVYIMSKFQTEKREPIKFYRKWEKGDKIIEVIL